MRAAFPKALAAWLDAHGARCLWSVRPPGKNQTVAMYLAGPSTCIVTLFDDGSFDVYASIGTIDVAETLRDAALRMDLGVDDEAQS